MGMSSQGPGRQADFLPFVRAAADVVLRLNLTVSAATQHRIDEIPHN